MCRKRALHAQGRLRAGTVDSWLLWNLTGGTAHATDSSNAARTQLLNLDTGQWDTDLTDWFGVPLEILPQVRASDSLFGVTCGSISGLPAGIPVHAIMGDSHAALFGHDIDAPGRIKVTLGTGSSLMCPTESRKSSANGMSETIAWNRGGAITYALEGNIAVSGHAAAFVSQMLGLPNTDTLTRLAETVPDSDGVTVLPALAGLGAPHWGAAARGLIAGLSL
ncbi:MAG: glycerol kinase, partial [Alphaproteobacteria bacterium]|nr:glycerol kinase [Alphaproteobacteria bacterium]